MEELQKIQAELKAPKGLYNKFGGYAYRSCENILEAVKPLLKKYGCTLVISDDMMMLGDRFYVKATATFENKEGKSITTTAFAREELTKKGMDASQITGSASSYARKYALNGLFCIDDTKDADTMDNTQQPAIPAKSNSDNNGLDDTLAMAVQELRAAQSKDTLNSIYTNYKSILGRNQRFLDEMNARAAQLGVKPKNKTA